MEIAITAILLCFFVMGYAVGTSMKDHYWRQRIWNAKIKQSKEYSPTERQRHFQVIKEQLN